MSAEGGNKVPANGQSSSVGIIWRTDWAPLGDLSQKQSMGEAGGYSHGRQTCRFPLIKRPPIQPSRVCRIPGVGSDAVNLASTNKMTKSVVGGRSNWLGCRSLRPAAGKPLSYWAQNSLSIPERAPTGRDMNRHEAPGPAGEPVGTANGSFQFHRFLVLAQRWCGR